MRFSPGRPRDRSEKPLKTGLGPRPGDLEGVRVPRCPSPTSTPDAPQALDLSGPRGDGCSKEGCARAVPPLWTRQVFTAAEASFQLGRLVDPASLPAPRVPLEEARFCVRSPQQPPRLRPTRRGTPTSPSPYSNSRTRTTPSPGNQGPSPRSAGARGGWSPGPALGAQAVRALGRFSPRSLRQKSEDIERRNSTGRRGGCARSPGDALAPPRGSRPRPGGLRTRAVPRAAARGQHRPSRAPRPGVPRASAGAAEAGLPVAEPQSRCCCRKRTAPKTGSGSACR